MKILLAVLILLLVSIIIVLVTMIVKARHEKDLRNMIESQNNKKTSSEVRPEGSIVQETPAQKVRNSVEGTREIFGIIKGIAEPADGKVRFVTLSADVVDLNKLDDADYSKGSSDLAMVRKDFKVAIDGDTKFTNGDMKSLKLGDFIKAVSPQDVYASQDFSAVEVEVFQK